MRRLFLALSLALPLAACAGGSAPRDQFYRLELAAKPVKAERTLPGVVEVGRFAADGLASGRAIVYSPRGQGQTVQSYAYQFWNEPPGVLLRDGLVEWLRGAQAADKIVTSELRVPPEYVIQGRIKRFEQLTGDAPGVVVEVEMGVTRLRGNDLVLLETYRAEKNAADGSVPAAVDAFQVAAADVFARFTADLIKARSQASAQ